MKDSSVTSSFQVVLFIRFCYIGTSETISLSILYMALFSPSPMSSYLFIWLSSLIMEITWILLPILFLSFSSSPLLPPPRPNDYKITPLSNTFHSPIVIYCRLDSVQLLLLLLPFLKITVLCQLLCGSSTTWSPLPLAAEKLNQTRWVFLSHTDSPVIYPRRANRK